MSQMLPIAIRGTGSYLPEEVIDNDYFVNYLDTTHEWILTRTGIKERRRVAVDESTSTMATNASKKALEDANLKPQDIDLIICATATGDYQFPATATIVQHQLGCDHIPAFDVGAACAGFMYAMVTGSCMVYSGQYKRALIIGAESLTRVGDKEDRSTVILFGDAAGAAIIEKTDNPEQGIIYSELGADGSRTDNIWLPAGGSKLPASETTVAERLHFLKMRGREVYKFAVSKLMELIDRALSENNITPDDIKLVIPHQSNLRIIESVREKLGFPKDKISVTIDRYGNTSAASIIVALDEARRSGQLQQGDTILMLGIGAGLAWGSMVLRL